VKVQAKNGRWYTRDHPKEIIKDGVMTFEEIRHWLKELSTNPDYGWTKRGVAGLERALGMLKSSLDDKLDHAWIWPREQVRLTMRINSIREGYIVPRRFPGRGGGKTEGVWTDPPKPPTVKESRVLRGTATPGGVRFAPPPKLPGLPSFATVFQNISTWDPTK
jgi:hypothetical protein